MKRLLLAVDGGGTKTTACLAAYDNDVHGSSDEPPADQGVELLGVGAAGPSNPVSNDVATAALNIDRAIKNAFRSAGLAVQQVSAACLGIAGVGSDPVRAAVEEQLQRLQLAHVLQVTDDIQLLDAATAWEKRCPLTNILSQHRIVLIAGTGSFAWGRTPDGHSARAGGWGYLLGDEGSGFAMGLAVLRSLCRSIDRGEENALVAPVLDMLGLKDPIALKSWAHRHPIPRQEIAALSRLVVSQAERDWRARSIRDEAVGALTELVTTVHHRLDMKDAPYLLILSGGVLAPAKAMVNQLLAVLAADGLSPREYHVVQQPVMGAIALAKALIKPK